MRYTKCLVVVLGATVSCGSVSAQTAADKPAAEPSAIQLAGGASAISETHGNWTVNCQVVNNTKVCSSSYQQFDGKNQRVFALELSPRGDEAFGNAALPFGLALQKGASLTVDDKPLGDEARPFSTCIIAGCLVPLTFDAATLTKITAGTTLKLNGIALESGEGISFSVPLSGFSSALKRTAELAK